MSFIVFTYGNESLDVLIIGGGITLLVFIVSFFIIFLKKSEKRWNNILRSFMVYIVIPLTLVAPSLWDFLTPCTGGVFHTEYILVQNIFTKEVSAIKPTDGCGKILWWYRSLPWDDDRNPHPDWRSKIIAF